MKLQELDDLRTLAQNALMWSMLTDCSKQILWNVNGVKALMSPDDWKDIFTAGLKKYTRVAEGLDGGFVFLGMRTSKMKKKEMSELIEYMFSNGPALKVRWSKETNDLLPKGMREQV